MFSEPSRTGSDGGKIVARLPPRYAVRLGILLVFDENKFLTTNEKYLLEGTEFSFTRPLAMVRVPVGQLSPNPIDQLSSPSDADRIAPNEPARSEVGRLHRRWQHRGDPDGPLLPRYVRFRDLRDAGTMIRL